MAGLSKKTKLIRSAARQAAEDLAAGGDSTILDAAKEIAGQVLWLSTDGVLEAFYAATMYDMERNGSSSRIRRVDDALNKYNREGNDD